MKCDKCGNGSVYHSTYIINGVARSTNLCRDCAIKEGVFSTAPTSLFDELMMDFADFLGYEKVENVICPVCKTSLKELKSIGKLGCPNCYESFRDEISRIINKIAPYQQHKQERIREFTEKESAKETKQEKIERLRAEMKAAVSEERYEEAAKIKKQITKLESANE